MAEISREQLYRKLNPIGFMTIGQAFSASRQQGHAYVELAHWVQQWLVQDNCDLQAICAQYSLNPARIEQDVATNLERLPRGGSSTSPKFSRHVDDAVQSGRKYADLLFNEVEVRIGHVIVGILKDPTLRAVMLEDVSQEFAKIRLETLADPERFQEMTANSAEAQASMPSADSDKAPEVAARPAQGMPGSTGGDAASALERFSVDLTARARDARIDPVVGRENEIRQIVSILMRRRQNNPILTGEAGVGKTAVVEGFAQRIAAGDVPEPLRSVTLRALDLGLLQAGASVRGEFENRLRKVIEEVQASPKPVILFIDEAHTLVGAGGKEGQGDAANLLKPALARGSLRTIAATTWAEFKQYFEKDPALTRRFQVVQVDEPDEAPAVRMLRGLAGMLEEHHQVELLDEAIVAAVQLSHRYIPARQLPDKALSVLDTACARVATGQQATPAQIEDTRRLIDAIEVERDILAREGSLGTDHRKRQQELEAELATASERLQQLGEHWAAERTLVDRVLQLRRELLEVTDAEAQHRADLQDEIQQARQRLRSHQGEDPLIHASVDEQAVAAVVADWTGIPVGRMVKDEIQAVLELADRLEARVIGQRPALEAIADRVRTSRAGLDNPSRPVGVFLLAGPSGVGKTETALALAESLYGGEQNLITINMSEFQEAHTVSTLKGAPPGYVGYGKGGVLTEAVRRKPYSVILLDEVEKAHPDVHEIFFQVFDKGVMEDGEGRRIDFKNTTILLTSNVGSETIESACGRSEPRPLADELRQAIRPELLAHFPAALLGRLIVLPYHPISDPMLDTIIRMQLDRVARRLKENHDAMMSYDDAVVQQIAARCTETQSGARAADAIITQTLVPQLSREVLSRMMHEQAVGGVELSVDQAGGFACRFAVPAEAAAPASEAIGETES